ncbi:hypothetical protein [Streptomyces sp. CoH17]|uniref:hypothetical protein n=1 Tax=Streptomyces sp. CoH17 TaxID=2992806 RepID=UPI00226D4A6B|nr:hypothetical protein [Streptomyces sp. CoH17]
MAESKGGSQTPARRRKAPKASAAFGKLNQLSASGALSKINNDPQTPTGSAPQVDGAPADPVQGQSTQDGTSTQPVPAAAPQEAEAEPTAGGGSARPAHVHESPVDGVPAEFVQDRPTPDSKPIHFAPAATLAEIGVADEESTAQLAPAERESAAASPITSAPTAGITQLDNSDSPAAATSIPAQTPVESAPQRLRSDDLAETDLPVHVQELPRGQESPSPGGAVTLRRAAGPAFPATSGFSERRMLDALPPQLAEKVQGLPVAYTELARSYRQAQATRTGTKPAKRNVRLHAEVAIAVNRQMVSDKRMLGLRNLKPSQYLDAAITLARHVSVTDLIQAADEFRDRHLGEEGGSASPNHYSISRENDEWLDDMMDELLLANTTGLHGHMVNVIVQSFLEQLRAEAPATD